MEQQLLQVSLGEIDLHYSSYRLYNEDYVNRMRQSMERYGQLQPVVVQYHGNGYRLLDGFKRYHARLLEGATSIESKVVELDDQGCKIFIYSSNKSSHKLNDYEEAMLVKSLIEENGLKQEDISELLGMSRSWVCRRLSLIQRLDPRLIDDIKLGVISSGHARELIKLPRGNQEILCKIIVEKGFTCRQSSILINSYLQATTPEQQNWILEHPAKVISKNTEKPNHEDVRLSDAGNRLLLAIRTATTAQHILIGHLIKDKITLLNCQDRNLLKEPLLAVAEKTGIIQKQIEEFQKT